MPGTGSNSTREALRLTKFAAKHGADAALVVAPYYNKPTQEGFYQHFKALAEAVDIAALRCTTFPGARARTSSRKRFARLGGIEEHYDGEGGDRLARSGVADYRDYESDGAFSGDDSLTLPLLAVGGRGVISVVGNIVPTDVIALCKAFDAGNIAEAQKWHRKLFPLCRDMLGLSTNPIPIKAAMKLLGRDTGELRLPMTPLDAASEGKLRKTLTVYGLL